MRINFVGDGVTRPHGDVDRTVPDVKFSKRLSSRARVHADDNWRDSLELKH